MTGYAAELAQARAVYSRRAWKEAYRALSALDKEAPLEVEDLERLACAAALLAKDTEFLRIQERIYHAECESKRCRRAARAAFWLAFRLFITGEIGQATAWLGRAQRLVEREPDDCAERGYLLLPKAFQQLERGDFVGSETTATHATAIGRACGDRDLSAFACNLQGRALLRQGQIEAGMALLDESMLAVTTGEVSPLLAGVLYCGVISTCGRVFALERAREWTRALSDWCEAQPELVNFRGECQVHRAELLQLGGAWSEALAEAQQACDERSESATRSAQAAGSHQWGEMLRLRGDFAAAEKAYARASQLGREPQPGLSLLRLAEGRSDMAHSGIRRALAETQDPLERAKLLPAAIEIAVASGDLESARKQRDELDAVASRFETEVLSALAAHARGLVNLAENDAQAGLGPLRRAFFVWQRLGAPYLEARVRVDLARACNALGDREGARLHLEAARAVFVELGAKPDVDALDAAQRGPEPTAPAAAGHGLTQRELQVLLLVAAGKTNKAIARELGLSEKTVDRHVSNIFLKLDVNSRASATAFAYQQNLVGSAASESDG